MMDVRVVSSGLLAEVERLGIGFIAAHAALRLPVGHDRPRKRLSGGRSPRAGHGPSSPCGSTERPT